MRIALVIILSITAIGFAPANACPTDIACEPQFWDAIDNREECEKRKDYCLGINACWAEWWRTAAYDYRDNKIIPGYVRCISRNRQ